MSDYLSRHPELGKCNAMSTIAKEYVSFLANHDVPKAKTLQEIIQATAKDTDFQEVINNIRSGKWSN